MTGVPSGFIRRVAALLVALALAGCASPLERFEARLHAAGLASEVVHGSEFDHLVVRKPGVAKGPLHVYIEGDGTPWHMPERPADDPTPNVPLAFELMLRDAHAAIYLGRPCYFGVKSRPCKTRLWTDQRYSEAVVESMARALEASLDGSDGTRVVLFGHSGGGVLAVLLGHRMPRAAAIVTVGANLDVAGWAALHGYTPLVGSLDPAQSPPTAGEGQALPERHFVGSDDRVVPPALVRNYARNRPAAIVIEWSGFDHVCCWADAWRQVLATVPAQ